MVAGTSNWNVVGELFGSLVEENSTRAALIASLVAQWTEAARSKGGSPDAAWKKFISYRTAVVTRCIWLGTVFKEKRPMRKEERHPFTKKKATGMVTMQLILCMWLPLQDTMKEVE